MAMASAECDTCKSGEETIEELYNQVILKLRNAGKIKQVSARLLTIATNYERVFYLYSILEELALLPKVKMNPKDDKVSVYYRNQGNKHFQQQANFEALQCYNLAFLYAVPTSENFIYAVSNRSAVFFAMKKYEESLEDIKFVFNKRYPEKLKLKLTERKQKCLSFLAAQGERKKDPIDIKIADIMKLKGLRNNKYVCASSKLKVEYSEEMGRHVIANEYIKVGEVLVQEYPYMAVPLQSQFLFCCSFCLSRKLNLYPCLTCTYMMYCSVACRENARSQYHMIECGLMPSVLSMKFNKMDWLALRATLRSRTDHVNWNDLFKAAVESESRINTDSWGCVKVDNKWIYDSKYYASIHTLESNIEKRSLSDVFRKSLESAVLVHFLSVLQFLNCDGNIALSQIAKRYVSGSMLLHMMTSPTNMHGISTNVENESGNFVDEYSIASGAYAFHSLLNHSCAPNVVRYSNLGSTKMSLIAIRPIRKGMQIFDNYGYHYALQERDARQSDLKFQYRFTCTCEACINDWPLHDDLEEAQGLPAGLLKRKAKYLSQEVIMKLMKGDKEAAVNAFQPLCELIELLEPFAPCKELAECQESLKQCLAIFEGVLPHGFTKLIEWKASPPCEATGGPPHH